MNIGEEIPTLSAGLVSLSAFNKVARTVNRLRKISLGPGLTGKATASGICLDAAPIAKSNTFPYGSQWCFGVDIVSGTTEVRIWNPLFHRAGLTIGSWLNSQGSFGTIPDRTSLSVTPGIASFAEDGGQMRIFITYIYDTVLGEGTLTASSAAADVMTLPTDDGAGVVDPLRYYKIPLYILEGTFQEGKPDADPPIPDRIINLRIYIDMIHGLFSPGLCG